MRYAVIEKPEDTHGVPQPFIALRRIASKLQANTKQTTRLINQLHETLSATFTEFATIQKDISSQWVLKLFAKYPTAERIANAHLSSIESIPQLRQEKARAIHVAAKSSVSSLKGEFAESLIKTQVAALEHSQKEVEKWFELLEKAYDELPAGRLTVTA